MRKYFCVFLIVGFVFPSSQLLLAHPGRLDSSGGHNDRRTGTYHSHRSYSSTYSAPVPKTERKAILKNRGVPSSSPVAEIPNSGKLIDGKTYVPLRFVSEKMGAKVNWLAQEKAAEISIDASNVFIRLGSKVAKVNGVEKTMESSPILINEKTFVPLRFVSENLGCKISWDATTKTVTIVSSKTNEMIVVPTK